MLPPELIEAIADELLEAGRTRSVVPRLTTRYAGMTVEDAYSVQALWAAAGRTRDTVWSAGRSA